MLPPGPRGPRDIGAIRQANNKPFVLVGQFFGPSGAGVSGATAYLHTWPTMAVVTTGLTASDGSCTFYPPTNGEYKITFYLAGATDLHGITGRLVPS